MDWDLITLLLIFQANTPLDQIDVKKSEHFNNERRLVKRHAICQTLNLLYHTTKFFMPIILKQGG